MEILVISHKYPPSIGGMQTHCYKLVQELNQKHKIHDLIWKSNYPRILFFLSVVVRALLILKRHPLIGAIYINDGLMALVCTPLLYLTKTPAFVTIHGLDVNFPWAPYQWWVRNILPKYHKIITVSLPTTQLCIKKGIPSSKLELIENAVDINFKEEPDNPTFREELSETLQTDLTNKFIICSLGRGIPRKGFSWFAENVVPNLPKNVVYIVLAREFPQERLFNVLKKLLPKGLFEKTRLMVGAEIDIKKLQQIIKDKNLETRVFHLSQFTKSRARIFEIIKHSNLYVMPNIEIPGDYEGFGLVALEAASQGTLTLAANVDGIPSAVKDNQNGYLIEGGNAQAWTDKIMELIEQPDQLKSKAEEFKSNTKAKSKSWETMAKKYAELFENSSK
ncbi:glycosyltransferase family 4 protein [Marinoscillum furvescens]|uniref:Glycosyltransferase involved in cell wall biosynthesis n=1 Tax=Marinoscillum furvescens DSM 4134 TaxID=1122208 RepID=A0A3D9L408_MARFU|nr:glycosyltransferase family 4 protein [Marinoscillum furvescens]RED98004.1 glycosyltransferase involved in cell wall biosynthesis [Marinoscillum furvescens DSM 4134]